MKEKLQNTYFTRLKLLLKSKLHARNLITAINTRAVAVVRESAAILSWTKLEWVTWRVGRIPRGMSTMHGALHHKSNFKRLYMKRNAGE